MIFFKSQLDNKYAEVHRAVSKTRRHIGTFPEFPTKLGNSGNGHPKARGMCCSLCASSGSIFSKGNAWATWLLPSHFSPPLKRSRGGLKLRTTYRMIHCSRRWSSPAAKLSHQRSLRPGQSRARRWSLPKTARSRKDKDGWGRRRSQQPAGSVAPPPACLPVSHPRRPRQRRPRRHVSDPAAAECQACLREAPASPSPQQPSRENVGRAGGEEPRNCKGKEIGFKILSPLPIGTFTLSPRF